MKIKDRLIAVNAKTRSKKYYQNLGYTEENGMFLVKCDDLPEHSGILETRICDYCGKEFTRRHEHHIITVKRFGKDVCGDCVNSIPELRNMIQSHKNKTWQEKYGCHPMQTQEVKNKVVTTWDEKYNGHPMHNEEIKTKWEHTVNIKYNGNSPLCSEEVRVKVRQTLYENGNVPTSSQQKTIYEMLCNCYDIDNCKLNLPLSNLSLDISLVVNNQLIDIEYDGKHWHEDKQQLDRRRDEYVKSQGYKILRIKSKHKIPSLEELQEKIEVLLNTDHTYTELVLSDW